MRQAAEHHPLVAGASPPAQASATAGCDRSLFLPLSSAMAVYGYVRVSTVKQASEGESLDVQRRTIADYAMMHGLVLTRTSWKAVSPARCRLGRGHRAVRC